MEILTDIASKIGFDWRLAITNLINFLIIFFLLVKYALPAIKKTIDERKKKIEEGLRMRDEADKIVDQAKADAHIVSIEANKKAESVMSKAESSGKTVLLEANSKASEIVQLANKEKEEAKQKGLRDAEGILAKDLGKILTKISNTAFDGKINAQINSDFVSKVFAENK